MNGALLRYQVAAYLVSVGLVVLFFVAVPLNHLADRPALSNVVSPIHGFLYMVYLVFAFDLARRLRWSLHRTLLLLIAGTIPVLSFLVERRVTREQRALARSSAATPAVDPA